MKQFRKRLYCFCNRFIIDYHLFNLAQYCFGIILIKTTSLPGIERATIRIAVECFTNYPAPLSLILIYIYHYAESICIHICLDLQTIKTILTCRPVNLVTREHCPSTQKNREESDEDTEKGEKRSV